MRQPKACSRGNTYKEKKRKKKGKGCTSNSGSSSNMGWVIDISSLCLDCKGKKRTKDKVEERSQQACQG